MNTRNRAMHCRIYKRYFFLLFPLTLLLMPLRSATGQGSSPYHNAYVEIWGNTGLFSLNYDYNFNRNIGLRVGLMGEPETDLGNPFNSFGFVSTGNLLFGSGSHRMELGAGGYLEIDQGDNTEDIFFTSTFGYRFQGEPGGWIFRAGITPTYNADDFHWRFGISIGRVFH